MISRPDSPFIPNHEQKQHTSFEAQPKFGTTTLFRRFFARTRSITTWRRIVLAELEKSLSSAKPSSRTMSIVPLPWHGSSYPRTNTFDELKIEVRRGAHRFMRFINNLQLQNSNQAQNHVKVRNQECSHQQPILFPESASHNQVAESRAFNSQTLLNSFKT